MSFILASSADLCQPDLVKMWLGTLRAGELLQDNACFVGFKQTLLPYKVVAYTGGFDCRVI